MKVGSNTPPVAAVFTDIAALHHTVPAESRLCPHVADKIDCSVRFEGSCGLSSATSNGTLAFRARNDRGEADTDPGGSANCPWGEFVSGRNAPRGKRKVDLLSGPPVLRDSNGSFPISAQVPRMFVPHILLGGQEEPQHPSLTTVETDTWHRGMSPYRPRYLKPPAEDLTAGEKILAGPGPKHPVKMDVS